MPSHIMLIRLTSSIVAIGVGSFFVYFLLFSRTENPDSKDDDMTLIQLLAMASPTESIMPESSKIGRESVVAPPQSNQPSEPEKPTSWIRISELQDDLKDIALNMDNRTLKKMFPNAIDVGESSSDYAIDDPNEQIQTVRLSFNSDAMEIKKNLLAYYREKYSLDSEIQKSLTSEQREEIQKLALDVQELNQGIKNGNSYLSKIRITYREKFKDGVIRKNEETIRDIIGKFGKPHSLCVHVFNSIFDERGKANRVKENIYYGLLAIWGKENYSICLRSNYNLENHTFGIVSLFYYLPSISLDKIWKEGVIYSETNEGNNQEVIQTLDAFKQSFMQN